MEHLTIEFKNNEILYGQPLNDVVSKINDIIDLVSEGYILKEVISTDITPTTSGAANIFYLATEGTYTHFGTSIDIPSGSIGIFKWNGSAWDRKVAKVCDPVSVSQNTDTGHIDISVGDDTIPVASIGDIRKAEQEGMVGQVFGTSNGNYGWLQEVNIPSGVAIRNIGSAKVNLYPEKNTEASFVSLNSGQIIVTTFAGTWLRASNIAGEYRLAIYRDLDAVILSNGLSLKSVVQDNAQKLNVLGVNLLNLLDTDYITGKYIYSDGSLEVSANFDISGYIPVEANSNYVISVDGSEPVSGSGVYVAYYDSSKALLSTHAMGIVGFTTPASCAYMRISIRHDSLDKQPMVNKGATRPEYYPYCIIGGYFEDAITLKMREERTARENATQKNTTISSAKTWTDYKITQSYYLDTNSGTDVNRFPVVSGTTLHIAGSLAAIPNLAVVAKFMDSEFFVSTTNYQNVSVNVVGGQYDFTIVVPEGFTYLILCTDTGVLPSVQRIQTALEMIDENADAISILKASANKCLSSLGKNAGTVKAATLSSGEILSLTDFPYHCYKGLAMSFYADITTFSKVIIGKGYDQYRGQWIEIDGTNVVQKEKGGQSMDVTTVSTHAHGLTFSEFIKVSLSCNYAGKCQVIIQTLGGYYRIVLEWGYQGNYAAFAKSDGSSLTNVVLNATSLDFRLPVWAFGDSYFGINQNRWVGCLKDFGYFNYLIDNLAGITSTGAFADLERCLAFGTPNYLLWCLGANDFENLSNAITKAQAVIAICTEKHITPILVTVPNMPERNFTTFNEWVKESGYRYIDISKAVGNPIYEANVDNWFPGYLSADKVHPTALGAQAMAMQVLGDFPEIMQYGIYSDDTTLDDTNTDQ